MNVPAKRRMMRCIFIIFITADTEPQRRKRSQNLHQITQTRIPSAKRIAPEGVAHCQELGSSHSEPIGVTKWFRAVLTQGINIPVICLLARELNLSPVHATRHVGLGALASFLNPARARQYRSSHFRECGCGSGLKVGNQTKCKCG